MQDILEMTIGERLVQNAERFGARPALQWEGVAGELVTLDYAGLLRVATDTARWLLRRAEPGDRVAIWGTNSTEWIVVSCASALAGLVVAPFNTAWTDGEVAHAIALTAPRLLFTGEDSRGEDLHARALSVLPPGSEAAVTRLREVAIEPTTAWSLDEGGPISGVEVRPDDAVLIQFTSGTTGRAKGATLSHRAVLNAGHLRVQALGADEHEVWANPAPLHHIGGSCVILMAALSSGACYVVMPRFEPARLVRMMTATGATRTGGVPTMLLALVDEPGAGEAVANLRGVGLGGASVPPSLVERLQVDFGAEVSVIYAQSECPVVTSTLPATSPEHVATTVGTAAPCSELRIVDPEGVEVGTGVIGEVCVRSPLTMLGYWGDPGATAAAFDEQGYLRTGDLGSLDADGVVRIHGRVREVIIRGGENIYPIEVEDALLRHPDVESAAVIAVPSDRWGEEVGAAVKLIPGGTVDPAALEQHVAAKVAHFKVPRHWSFVDAFPLTASGKIRKVELSGLFSSAGKPPVQSTKETR